MSRRPGPGSSCPQARSRWTLWLAASTLRRRPQVCERAFAHLERASRRSTSVCCAASAGGAGHPISLQSILLRGVPTVRAAPGEAAVCCVPLPVRWPKARPPAAYRSRRCPVRSHRSVGTRAEKLAHIAQRVPQRQRAPGPRVLASNADRVPPVAEARMHIHPLRATAHGWSPAA